MKKFIFSLLLILGLIYLSFKDRKAELTFSRININGATRIQFAEQNDSADFERIGNSDIKKIEADLASYNLTIVSPVFISKNGTYIITFAKTPEQKIKRILFINGKPYADDVQSVSKNRIATTSGEIQSISALTTRGD